MVHINHSQQPHRRSLYNQSVSHFGPKELLMAVYSPPFMIGIRGGGSFLVTAMYMAMQLLSPFGLQE